MNLLFTELPSPKMHPANIGHDLTRDQSPLSGLKKTQYLDRVLSLEIFRGDLRHVPTELRTVFLTGAKVVKNAIAPATMGDWDDQRLELIKFYTDLAHSLDPELIFDGVVSAEIHPTVEYISVSPEAFVKLGRVPEKRKFSYAAMESEDERALWYVHRALSFRAAGFDAITFEQGIPRAVIELFENELPLCFSSRELPGARDPKKEDPVEIAKSWITQKQLEG